MIEIRQGDCLSVLKTLPPQRVQMVCTSPPYYNLRSYLPEGHTDKGHEIGREDSVDAYVTKLVMVFGEVRRVLKPDGTCWLNLADSMRPDKCEAMVPHRVAMALMEDGWICRQTIIWHKPNGLPEPARDRCVRNHEYLFLLSKQPKYYFNHEAIREPSMTPGKFNGSRSGKTGANGDRRDGGRTLIPGDGFRNRRSVWTVNTHKFPSAHFAVFPPKLIEPCILAGSRPGDVVLDPFFGAGTSGVVCQSLGRDCIGIELNPAYVEIAERRIRGHQVIESQSEVA